MSLSEYVWEHRVPKWVPQFSMLMLFFFDSGHIRLVVHYVGNRVPFWDTPCQCAGDFKGECTLLLNDSNNFNVKTKQRTSIRISRP